MKPAACVEAGAGTEAGKRSLSESLLDRRAFLGTAVLSAIAVLCGEWWARKRVEFVPRQAPFPIAGAAELPVGSALSFSLPETATPALLIRLASDTYAAFDRRCPHLGCPVQWSVAAQRFECPCHAAVFEAGSGRVLAGPPRRGLRVIPLEQRDGALWAQPVSVPPAMERNEAERSV